jgi:hypothetical protein
MLNTLLKCALITGKPDRFCVGFPYYSQVNVSDITGHYITSLFEAASLNISITVYIDYWDPGEHSQCGY